MAKPRRQCPECHSDMHRIRLIDKTHNQTHAEFEYTVPEAQRSFWMGQYPVEGRVGAYMCDRCGRLLLYGVPYFEDESARDKT